MDIQHHRYTERPLVKTKIIATVGPACESIGRLRKLVDAGADVFRLNFAHADHDWLNGVVASIRTISDELQRPIAVLGDLAGPKIRLGELSEEGICCVPGGRFEFVRQPDPQDPTKLTCTYDRLLDDLQPNDCIMLADGLVRLRVVEKHRHPDRAVCVVEQPGCIRSRQGVNLPGVVLNTPSLTEKDRQDLAWAVEHEVDYIGMSFVRSADDVRSLRSAIAALTPSPSPSGRGDGGEGSCQVVAKIEKMEAVSEIETILDEADAVMVARGDLGVEVDIARVPSLQKRIIRLCNQRRIPVITATQMLDSMQTCERPTRAEASDVANAVLDGSDALMLSGETAVGHYPDQAVAMMSRIANEAERMVQPNKLGDLHSTPRIRARLVTEAVTLGAGTVAEHLHADLIVVATHSGKTAMAVSKQRSPVPILALSDRPETARRMCLYWGVTPLQSEIVDAPPEKLIQFVVDWGKRQDVLGSGSHIVVVGSTDWSRTGHDLMMVHAVS